MSCPYIARKDDAWYCTAKGGYVSYDSYCSSNYDSCTYYNNGNSGCFLSTACVVHKGLNDNCYELAKLREFRDNYLLSFEAGRQDVKEYYEIAPKIVELICESSCASSTFEDIYNMILVCVDYIENGKFDEAHKYYKDFVMELKEKFK